MFLLAYVPSFTEPLNKLLQYHLLLLYQYLLWTLPQPPFSHHLSWVTVHKQAAHVQRHRAKEENGSMHQPSAASTQGGDFFVIHICATSGPAFSHSFFFLLEGRAYACTKIRIHA